MLTPPTINNIRALLAKALKAGLIEYTELASAASIAGALDVEEQLYLTAQKKQAQSQETSPALPET